MEDNKYKLTEDTIDNVMGMFGFAKNAKGNFIKTRKKDMFDEKTMQNMYKNIAKTFL